MGQCLITRRGGKSSLALSMELILSKQSTASESGTVTLEDDTYYILLSVGWENTVTFSLTNAEKIYEHTQAHDSGNDHSRGLIRLIKTGKNASVKWSKTYTNMAMIYKIINE